MAKKIDVIEKEKTPEEKFTELVVKLKNEKSVEELKKMLSIQPACQELVEFLAAREALKQLTKPTKESGEKK